MDQNQELKTSWKEVPVEGARPSSHKAGVTLTLKPAAIADKQKMKPKINVPRESKHKNCKQNTSKYNQHIEELKLPVVVRPYNSSTQRAEAGGSQGRS